MMSCFNSVSLINLCRRVPPPARLNSTGTRDGGNEGAGAGGRGGGKFPVPVDGRMYGAHHISSQAPVTVPRTGTFSQTAAVSVFKDSRSEGPPN